MLAIAVAVRDNPSYGDTHEGLEGSEGDYSLRTENIR
jgi:hypothetical protein